MIVNRLCFYINWWGSSCICCGAMKHGEMSLVYPEKYVELVKGFFAKYS